MRSSHNPGVSQALLDFPGRNQGTGPNQQCWRVGGARTPAAPGPHPQRRPIAKAMLQPRATRLVISALRMGFAEAEIALTRATKQALSCSHHW